jgi:hypothetical protein
VALLFCDSLDHNDLSTDAGVRQKWTELCNSNAIAGRIYGPSIGRILGKNAFRGDGNQDRGFYKVLTTTVDTMGVGAWFFFEGVPNGRFLYLGELSSTNLNGVHVDVRGDAAGHLQITRNGTQLGANSTLTVLANTWYWIELKVKVHDTLGTYEVKVNGTTYISGTGADTRNGGTGIPTGGGWCTQGNVGTRFSDFVIWDTTGAVANDFFGPIQIHCRRPIEAGNYAQWTPNYGPNFANVGDVSAPDDLSTFNQSATAGQKDTFKGADLPISSGSVLGIQHVIRAKQDGGAARTLRPIQRSGSTDYNGTSFSVPGSFAYQLEAKSINPATSAAYTVSDVNDAEFGYELVS